MANPPKSTPHSDLDGVHRDERPNVETATEAGEDAGDLPAARDQAKGKPPYSTDQPGREDRSG